MVKKPSFTLLGLSLLIFSFFSYTSTPVLACEQHDSVDSEQHLTSDKGDKDSEDKDSSHHQKKKEKKKKSKKIEEKPKSFIRGEIEEPLLELDDKAD